MLHTIISSPFVITTFVLCVIGYFALPWILRSKFTMHSLRTTDWTMILVWLVFPGLFILALILVALGILP